MNDLMEQPLTNLLAQLTYSTLYIITVILALGLTFLNGEEGCLMFMCKIWAWVHIIIYIFAIYFYITGKL